MSALQTDAKDNLVDAINEAAESGGSSDAVLYTPQTLTDVQKKQARENVMAMAGMSVSYMYNSDHTDDIFSVAGNAGLVVVTTDAGRDENDYGIVAPALVMLGEITGKSQRVFVTGANGYAYIGSVNIERPAQPNLRRIDYLISSSRGELDQQTMASAPTEDMQIATKKYVDDKECILQSTTPGSVKKFKITVDDSGTITTKEV